MYGNRNLGGGQGISPVKVGQELDVKIEAVGEKGDGIAKVKGFVLFVPGVKENDEVRIKITKVLKNVGFAEAIGDAEGPITSEEQPTKEKNEPNSDADVSANQNDVYEDNSTEVENPEDSEDFGDEEEDALK